MPRADQADQMVIAAVVTAYHPDERLAQVVESALASCARVIVADNTPGESPSAAEKLDHPNVKVLRSGRNLGLAAALNLGLREVPDEAGAVLFLDQDSVLPPDLVPGLAAHLADPTIGVVGPAPVDAEKGGAYETLSVLHGDVSDRYSVITSGMLVRRDCFQTVPAFREDFFVDCVDIDFCLRLRRAGVRIVRDKQLLLPHSIGDGRDHRLLGVLPVRVLHYAAWRHYWVARNGMVLTREHWRALPGFALINALFMARWLAATAVFEPQRRTHVPAILRGLRDGLTGRLTPGHLPSGAEYRGPGHGGSL
ncbi:MAG: glycosyltransferase family 2 protein [Actinocrinis sp.]